MFIIIVILDVSTGGRVLNDSAVGLSAVYIVIVLVILIGTVGVLNIVIMVRIKIRRKKVIILSVIQLLYNHMHDFILNSFRY